MLPPCTQPPCPTPVLPLSLLPQAKPQVLGAGSGGFWELDLGVREGQAQGRHLPGVGGGRGQVPRPEHSWGVLGGQRPNWALGFQCLPLAWPHRPREWTGIRAGPGRARETGVSEGASLGLYLRKPGPAHRPLQGRSRIPRDQDKGSRDTQFFFFISRLQGQPGDQLGWCQLRPGPGLAS